MKGLNGLNGTVHEAHRHGDSMVVSVAAFTGPWCSFWRPECFGTEVPKGQIKAQTCASSPGFFDGTKDGLVWACSMFQYRPGAARLAGRVDTNARKIRINARSGQVRAIESGEATRERRLMRVIAVRWVSILEKN